MHGGEDKFDQALPSLASAVITRRHRLILLIAGLLLALPLGLAFLRNRNLLPFLLLYLTLLVFVFWLISRYEVFFLRRGLTEGFLRFYSLQESFREDLDFSQLTERLCQGIAEWLGCKKVYFYLVDEVLDKFNAVARVDLEGWKEESIPKDASLVNALTFRRAPLLLPSDSILFTEQKFRLLVPVRAGGKLAGFIAIGEKRGAEPYYQVELRNLELLATQLGLFLKKEEYRSALRRQLRELTSAQEILSRMMSNPYHLDFVLESLVESLKHLFPKARLVEVCLWDEKERKMVVRKVSGPGIAEGHKYNIGEGFSGTIARDRRSILLKDLQALNEKPGMPSTQVCRSVVGVPLIYQGKLVGSLEMDSLYPEAFGENDLRFLESLAPYFAAIIHNIQAHHSMIKEKEALLEAYNLIGKMLASGLKGEELLTYIATMVNTFMDSDACAVRIWGGEKVLNSYWAGSESIVPPPDWEIEICSRQDEVIIPQLEKPGTFSDSRGMRAFMAASVYLKGEKIGWVGLWRREPRAFSDAEMSWLKAFSAQVAAIWERVVVERELEKVSQELESLKYLREAIEGASSFDELARKGLEAIVKSFKLHGVPCCLLFFVSGPGGEPAVAMSSSFNPRLVEVLTLLSPRHPVDPEAIASLKGYFKELKLFPLEFAGKIWGIFVYQGVKVPDIALFLYHLSSRAARLALEKELEGFQENFLQLLSLVSDGLYLVDKNGEILHLDEKACYLTGFSQKELIGQNCRLLYPDDMVPLALEINRTGNIALRNTYIRAKDGSFVPVKEVATLVAPEKTAVAFWDLSREKDLEKVQDVVTIFLVHEIGKLATKIFSGLYLYKEDRKRGKSLDELIELSGKMIEAVQKLQEIVNLEGGRIRLNFVRLDVTRLARAVMEEFAAGGTHRFSFEGPKELVLALADEKMVEIILSNLLDNAVKYSPPGSLVTVKIETEGDEVRISVKDEGEGIPVPLQRKIFDKFYRIETGEAAKVSGLGLGLYFCKLIVEAHGGRIWVESSPGCGSTFSFTLPKAL